MKLADCMDVCKCSNTSLDFRAALARCLVNALDHLLLPIDPVEVIPEHRQAHWLKYVGVLDHNPIGACRGGGKRSTREWKLVRTDGKLHQFFSLACAGN